VLGQRASHQTALEPFKALLLYVDEARSVRRMSGYAPGYQVT
jgi:hypothetical protein